MTHAIRVSGLGKRYRLGATRAVANTLRDEIMGLWRGRGRPAREQFWALRDVSFDVGEGEVVGVIGRNGAGKSTLLKILARIMEPTAGEVRLRGRVGSLLEVGTGFHPELTGRENIFMSGAALGMRRAEILRKFDEIVDFSGVEPFIDTPIKRYSSGMAVRLGFAVAAHLEPEILLVDEVLAVGDAEFQKKCLGQISEAVGGGRTVIFVSHNLSMVAQLCRRGILLANGRLLKDGPIDETLHEYLAQRGSLGTTSFELQPDIPVQVQSISLLNQRGEPVTTVDWNDDIRIAVDVFAHQASPIAVKLQLRNLEGVHVFQGISADALKSYCVLGAQEARRFEIKIDGGWLNPGSFSVRASVLRDNATQFDAQFSDIWQIESASKSASFMGERAPSRALLRLPASWSVGDATPLPINKI